MSELSGRSLSEDSEDLEVPTVQPTVARGMQGVPGVDMFAAAPKSTRITRDVFQDVSAFVVPIATYSSDSNPIPEANAPGWDCTPAPDAADDLPTGVPALDRSGEGGDPADPLAKLIRRCLQRVKGGQVDVDKACQLFLFDNKTEYEITARLTFILERDTLPSLKTNQVKFLSHLLDLPLKRSVEEMRVALELEANKGLGARTRARPDRLQVQEDDARDEKPPAKRVGRPNRVQVQEDDARDEMPPTKRVGRRRQAPEPGQEEEEGPKPKRPYRRKDAQVAKEPSAVPTVELDAVTAQRSPSPEASEAPVHPENSEAPVTKKISGVQQSLTAFFAKPAVAAPMARTAAGMAKEAAKTLGPKTSGGGTGPSSGLDRSMSVHTSPHPAPPTTLSSVADAPALGTPVPRKGRSVVGDSTISMAGMAAPSPPQAKPTSTPGTLQGLKQASGNMRQPSEGKEEEDRMPAQVAGCAGDGVAPHSQAPGPLHGPHKPQPTGYPHGPPPPGPPPCPPQGRAVKLWFASHPAVEPVLVGQPQLDASLTVREFFSPCVFGQMEEFDAMGPAEGRLLYVFRIDQLGGKRPITQRAASTATLGNTSGFVLAMQPFPGALWAPVGPDGGMAAYAGLGL